MSLPRSSRAWGFLLAFLDAEQFGACWLDSAVYACQLNVPVLVTYILDARSIRAHFSSASMSKTGKTLAMVGHLRLETRRNRPKAGHLWL